MIDRNLIDPKRLIDILLDTQHGNLNHWWRLTEIVVGYMPPFPSKDTESSIQVRVLVDDSEPLPGPGIVTHRHSYLRHGGGMAGWSSGGYFWDMYGSPWLSVEYAFLALIHAPVPPALLKPICWSASHHPHRDDLAKGKP